MMNEKLNLNWLNRVKELNSKDKSVIILNAFQDVINQLAQLKDDVDHITLYINKTLLTSDMSISIYMRDRNVPK